MGGRQRAFGLKLVTARQVGLEVRRLMRCLEGLAQTRIVNWRFSGRRPHRRRRVPRSERIEFARCDRCLTSVRIVIAGVLLTCVCVIVLPVRLGPRRMRSLIVLRVRVPAVILQIWLLPALLLRAGVMIGGVVPTFVRSGGRTSLAIEFSKWIALSDQPRQFSKWIARVAPLRRGLTVRMAGSVARLIIVRHSVFRLAENPPLASASTRATPMAYTFTLAHLFGRLDPEHRQAGGQNRHHALHQGETGQREFGIILDNEA